MLNNIYVKKFRKLQNYQDFMAKQLEFHRDVLNKNRLGYFVFLEHEDVYTIGRFSKIVNDKGLDVFKSTRGGSITYHGPGQIIFYPIINLRLLGLRLKDFVEALEDSVLLLLDSFNLIGKKNLYGPGVWIDNRKIASIGLAVRRGVTLHGLSLNLNCSLDKFNLIHPCGNPDVTVGNLDDFVKIEKNKCFNMLAEIFLDQIKCRVHYLKKKEISLSADSFESEP